MSTEQTKLLAAAKGQAAQNYDTIADKGHEHSHEHGHSHDHGHSHYHGHSHDGTTNGDKAQGGIDAATRRREKEKKVLTGALLFCFVFMILEFASGIIAHSLALLTDATHLLTDVGSYALSIGALVAAGKTASKQFNYGWARAEVLGTLMSLFSIWALVLWILVEATYRIYDIYMCSRVPSQLAQLSAKQQKASAAALIGGNGAKKIQTSSLAAQEPADWLTALRAGGGNNNGGGADEAIRQCERIDSQLMIIVGILGMVVNMVCATILYLGGSHGHSHLGGAHDHGHEHGHGSSEEEQHGHSHNDDNDDEAHAHASPDTHAVAVSTNGQKSVGRRMTGFAVSAAFLHALGDCVQSVGVILAGVFIYIANRISFGVPSFRYSLYNLADPFCSIFFAIVTVHMTRSLLSDLFGILMESTPATVDYEAVFLALRDIDGVVDVHDLHVWSLSADYIALSAHLVADNVAEVLHAAQDICKERFGIDHTTIQVDNIETGESRCVGNCSTPPFSSLNGAREATV